LILVVTYEVTGPLTVQIVGEGRVVPDLTTGDLVLGKIYTVQAKPGAGQIFLGWAGVSPTNNPKVSFIMTSNMVLTANFVPNPFPEMAGTYNGVFLDPDPNFFRPEDSGFFRLQLNAQGAFSGKVTLQEGDYAFHGRFDPFGNAQVGVVRRAL